MASRFRKHTDENRPSIATASNGGATIQAWPKPQPSAFHQAQRATSATSNASTPSRGTTNTDHNPNSAHYTKKYPCTFKGCGKRFEEKKSLNKHKDSEHDYCMPCNLDFEDDEALHRHKMESPKHIVCPICGIDFKSVPGRDRHAKQMHSTQQNVQCRGCHKMFAKGAALILHFEQNLCAPLKAYNNPDEPVHQKQMLETQRALMAMELNMQEKENRNNPEWGSVRDDSTVDDTNGGGVNLQPSLMDDQGGKEEQSMKKLQPALKASNATSKAPSAASDAASDTSSDTIKEVNWPLVSPTSVHGPQDAWPVVGTSTKGKDKVAEAQARGQERLANAQIESTWSKDLFPNAPPTPASIHSADTADTAATLNSDTPSQSGINSVPIGRMLKPDPMTNVFQCPFPNCDKPFVDKDDLITHIKTHCGVQNKCASCFRNFKTPSALTAHMESASTRCRIRETRGYGNALSLVSGGFLGLSGTFEDGTAKFDSTKIPDSYW